MSEQENKPIETPRPKRSRWLFAVLGALVIAVGRQSAYLWQVHAKLEKAIAAEDGDKDDGWIEIPRPDDTRKADPGQSRSSASSPGNLSLGIPDPFLQPFDPQSWDPFQEMSRMRAEMDRMFNQAFGRFQGSPQFGNLAVGSTFSPSFDLTEEPDRYVAKIDVPGASEHDIKVTLEDQNLTVSGTRTDTHAEQKDGRILRQERVIGQFQRTMTLPEPVDDTNMETNYENGVFTVTLPKLHPSNNKPSESVRMQ
jgi:HSP20 family protein